MSLGMHALKSMGFMKNRSMMGDKGEIVKTSMYRAMFHP